MRNNKGIVSNVVEREGDVLVSIKKPSLRYFNEFMSMRCAIDLLLLKVFPNAKEITEQMGMKNACRVAHLDQANPDLRAAVVGDGSTPRLAALLALVSKWTVYSIDPALNMEKDYRSVRRLVLYKEDVAKVNGKFDVIFLPHAHVKFYQIAHLLRPDSVVITMECCVPFDGPMCDTLEYTDWGVHSPHRTIKILRGLVE